MYVFYFKTVPAKKEKWNQYGKLLTTVKSRWWICGCSLHHTLFLYIVEIFHYKFFWSFRKKTQVVCGFAFIEKSWYSFEKKTKSLSRLIAWVCIQQLTFFTMCWQWKLSFLPPEAHSTVRNSFTQIVNVQ